MLVVYYCAVDIFDYIVLSCCKVCSIIIFLGVKRLNFWHNFGVGDNLVGTAVRTIGLL